MAGRNSTAARIHELNRVNDAIRSRIGEIMRDRANRHWSHTEEYVTGMRECLRLLGERKKFVKAGRPGER